MDMQLTVHFCHWEHIIFPSLPPKESGSKHCSTTVKHGKHFFTGHKLMIIWCKRHTSCSCTIDDCLY